MLKLVLTDGGRSKYFKANNVGDCVTRAIAIASHRDYKEVYNMIFKFTGVSPRNGVKKTDTRKIMEKLGYKWIPTMHIGSGMKVHLQTNEIPMDKTIICSVSCHVVAVINGVVYDAFDCRRNGTRGVYGYWVVK